MVYNGSLLRITLDGEKVFHETEASVSMELSTRERATKDTNGNEIAPDIITWSASGSSLAVLSATGTSLTLEDLYDKFIAKEVVNVEFTTGTSGDAYYRGQGYLTSLEIAGSNNEDATASWSITGSGEPEKAIIS